MKLKIVTAMLLSAILSGCAVYPEPKVNKSSYKTKTLKRTTTTKKAVVPSKRRVVKPKSPAEKRVSSSSERKPDVIVKTPKINTGVEQSLPKIQRTSSLNKAHFASDRQAILNCEKQGLCMKEIVIVDNSMLLKIEMPKDIYDSLKNKDNAITYFNNDVKIFKSNPSVYLKKYGLIHKKYTNASEMLMNLPEVQIKDIFGSEIFVRFKPY